MLLQHITYSKHQLVRQLKVIAIHQVIPLQCRPFHIKPRKTLDIYLIMHTILPQLCNNHSQVSLLLKNQLTRKTICHTTKVKPKLIQKTPTKYLFPIPQFIFKLKTHQKKYHPLKTTNQRLSTIYYQPQPSFYFILCTFYQYPRTTNYYLLTTIY